MKTYHQRIHTQITVYSNTLRLVVSQASFQGLSAVYTYIKFFKIIERRLHQLIG